MKLSTALFLLCTVSSAFQRADLANISSSWTFVVSGDSRNCGDLIMPVIAQRAKAAGARFYWHLGDLRALYGVDEDYAGLHRRDPAMSTMTAYLKNAWDDFEQNQVTPFARLPFFLGIGNHETIDRTREQFIAQFQKLLNIEPIRRQREADQANDHTVRTYYHWHEPGTDLINLDNAKSVFDDAQLQWAMKVTAADETNPDVQLLLVGMHESLPDSYSQDHSMTQGSDKGASGRALYKRLLEFQKKSGKPVHIFSSHSHYYLTDIYNTGAWQANGGVLSGTLIGTAGAQHYSVPPEVKSFATWAENEYGYAVVRVNPVGASRAVQVEFVPVKRQDVGAELENKFGRDTVDFCFSKNWRATLHGDPY
ncbi:MAG: hypothetical protein JO336_20580 [Acidobacteriia bacterium]|nr:hypothetical protein [Terriglobia bacterium]